MEITVNTQSSIRMEGERVFYFDPLEIQGNPEDADMIFVTHDHFDHFSPADIQKAACRKTILIVPESMKDTAVEKSGIPKERVFAVKPDEYYDVNGLSFKTVASYNIGKAFHPKEKGYCGYVVPSDGVRYYVTGDTDETPELLETKCDVMLLPIGGKYTSDYREAAACAAKAKAKTVIPTHYGSIIGKKTDGADFAALLKELAPEKETVLKELV